MENKYPLGFFFFIYCCLKRYRKIFFHFLTHMFCRKSSEYFCKQWKQSKLPKEEFFLHKIFKFLLESKKLNTCSLNWFVCLPRPCCIFDTTLFVIFKTLLSRFFKNKFYMFFFYFRNLCLFQKARLEEQLTVFSAMCLTREPGSSAQTRRGRCTTVRAVWRPTPGSTCTTSGSGTNVGTIYQARSTYLGLPHFLAPPPLYLSEI